MNTPPDDTVPPFPAEADWLAAEPPPGLPTRDFADRVLAAVREDQELDRALAAADADLPRIVLASYAAPEPSADFAARTAAALQQDRRNRGQQLLARHVDAVPTATLVQRTLQALAPEPAAAPPAARRWRRTGWFLAAAAAAALLLWWRPGADERAPRATVAAAAAGASDAVFAALAARHDPLALDTQLPDGVALLFPEVR